MEHEIGSQLLTLGILLIIAYVLGRLGRRVGLPAIPIYMIVGLAASENVAVFPLEVDGGSIELIAIFGLLLLLFNLGLEFDQDEFYSNAWRLIAAGGSYILINMAGGLAFGFMLGWGSREALIIAGMTATSSSAIVTKLLIELNRLAHPETPMILGVTVVEDIFIAIYLAVVAVVLSGESDIGPVLLKLGVAFTFLIAMFIVARFGGTIISRLIRTKDDELFTVLAFGLLLLFGGIGEQLGVTDAIGAFLIGLILGSTRFRHRIEQIAIPLRDVFGAFFFVNFGLTMNPATFLEVLGPVLIGIAMTIVLNTIAGQVVAWLQQLGPRAGVNAAAILLNRGEFALILATLAIGAGLDSRVSEFAGLYVLIMAIIGPIIAGQSERIGAAIFRDRRKTPQESAEKRSTRLSETEAIALMEGVDADGAGEKSTHARPNMASDEEIDRIMRQARGQSDNT